MTIKQILTRYSKRVEVLTGTLFKLGKRVTAITPQDNQSINDVAFGILTNGEMLVATDFKLYIEIGYFSHINMLIDKGYAKDLDDIHPKIDYKIRGIIKHNLKNDVIFWETPEILLQPINFKALQKCLKILKNKNLIKDTNKVYGSGIFAAVGTVKELLG